MLNVQQFTFFPEYFGENTYVLSDATGACVVVDPGAYHRSEHEKLARYIQDNGLRLEKVILTHCHIDHVMGLAQLLRTFPVPVVAHPEDRYNLVGAEAFARMYGLDYDPAPEPTEWIAEGDVVRFGETALEVIFTPGHSKGHVSYYHQASKQVFSGDVLFRDSVGRTDLPGGSTVVLIDSIVNKLFPLGDDVRVYPGHMEPTTIGRERMENEFVREMQRFKR